MHSVAAAAAAAARFLHKLIALQASRYAAQPCAEGLCEWTWRTVKLATGVAHASLAQHWSLMRSEARAFYKGIRAEIYFYLPPSRDNYTLDYDTRFVYFANCANFPLLPLLLSLHVSLFSQNCSLSQSYFK